MLARGTRGNGARGAWPIGFAVIGLLTRGLLGASGHVNDGADGFDSDSMTSFSLKMIRRDQPAIVSSICLRTAK